MKTVYAVIDGEVLGIIAFENKTDAETWASQNQEGGESLALGVTEVKVFPDVASAGKRGEFF